MKKIEPALDEAEADLVAAYLAGEYRERPGLHRHLCPKCGVVWEHADGLGGCKAAHRCPLCGALEWLTYEGPLAPGEVRREGR